MKSPTRNLLLSSLVLITWGHHLVTLAAPPVDLIDFNSNGGDFTVVSTNNPPDPWHYDGDSGTWRASDTNDCTTAFRSSRLNSPYFTVPAAGPVTIAFTHRYSFEADSATRWDGGQLRLSVNHGRYQTVPAASFIAEGYNNTVGGADVPNSELAGQSAFTSQSLGYDGPEYITSIATLGTFNANDTISIQFLAAWDDCSQGTVPNWEIDSVQFSPTLEDRRPPPSFADASLPANAAVVELTSHTLRSVPVGYIALQWYKDMVAIPQATGSNYLIAKMSAADVGHYYVQAVNSIGSTTSHVANVTLIPDTTAPTFVSAECGTTPEEIIVKVSEPLRLDNGQGSLVTDQFTWLIEKVSGPGLDPGQPALVTYTEGTKDILLTAESGSLDPLASYKVVLVADMFDEAAVPNKLPANSSVPIVCPEAILVRATGAGPFTFDSAPPAKFFSTFGWAGGANGTADTPALVGSRVQLLDASRITVALAPAAGAPPAAASSAQYASDGKYLITRPTAVAGAVVMATLLNDSGATRSSLTLSYDLKVEAPVVEEVPGHLVYFSYTGASNTWVQVPGISGATGSKTALLDLSDLPWTVGRKLYVLWVDDNGSGSPDNANEIDNVAISLGLPGLSITFSSPNVVITWPPGSGVLQSKVNLSDATWTDVPGAGSSGSATVAATGARKFFTLRAP